MQPTNKPSQCNLQNNKVKHALSINLAENIQYIASCLPIGVSFDLMTRDLFLGETRAYFLGVNGFCKTEVLQQIFRDLQDPLFNITPCVEDLYNFVSSKIGYASVTLTDDWEEIFSNVLSGPVALFVDGFAKAILLDVRTYPTRGIAEPEMERVTKGPRDGFVETMLFNANLLRRRVRSKELVFSVHKVGDVSHTDIAIAYLQDSVNVSLLKELTDTIDSLRMTSLTMGAKSLEEMLLKKRWWNPLPGIQMTERPDVASSYLMEGHILVLIDNSPLVLILPCSLFQFTQSPEDYYKSPSVGTYFRLVRFLCIPVSLLLLPIFLIVNGPSFRLFFYILVVEFILDLFQYSSSLTSGKYSGALSIVSGLIIGDIAVELKWASTEVLFYAAITLLASLSIADSSFRDGLRLFRIFLILCTGLLGWPGLLVGLVCVLISVAKTPTFGGFSYLWPLFPFNKKALGRLLFRSPTPKAQPSSVWKRGKVK